MSGREEGLDYTGVEVVLRRHKVADIDDAFIRIQAIEAEYLKIRSSQAKR